MKYFYFLFLFCSTLHFSQNNTPQKESSPQTVSLDLKIRDAKVLAISNPEEAKKLLNLKAECEKAGYKDGAMKSSMGLLMLYHNSAK